mmetsp:Transcript_45977/g.68425  ORF Transcript_45977/g.68425 Transcript_45977/m.68425 type:complete len:91 (+) Transcript_45977:315-587(+)
MQKSRFEKLHTYCCVDDIESQCALLFRMKLRSYDAANDDDDVTITQRHDKTMTFTGLLFIRLPDLLQRLWIMKVASFYGTFDCPHLSSTT